MSAAARLFVERGFPNVKMSDIAAEVGITASALYRHFAGKSELLNAVLGEAVEKSRLSTAPSGDLATMLAGKASAILDVPGIGILWSRESRHLKPDDRARVVTRIASENQEYARAIRARHPHLSPDESSLLAGAVTSVLTSASPHAHGLSRADHIRVLKSAALAAADTRLEDVDARPAATHTALEPTSQREKLLSVAGRLFGTMGYESTSLDDIGSAADVTGPSLYSHFTNKAAILQEVLDRAEHALWIDLHAAIRSTDDPWRALIVVAESYARLGQSQPHVIAFIVAEGARASGDSQSRQREYLQEWVGLLRRARPGLSMPVARALVRAAVTVVNDFSRTRSVVGRSDFTGIVTSIAGAVLQAPER
ncbi:TetR family transcriptional regulator [Acrocarpospora pleiomorpha]|uniref:TetR family transcriptional regulator n=1 Tax=Acrocarpospora pleiomorpha TaxID=90975 RepID=A0A5M3X8Y6_9ACTN|nr:TetR/AcrR family transcriptional regulator [Acrocarpospora pleiomorpha]GES17182.1 TetR family transcriptional regulator [Acrocarpospora pleiomorpha]